MARGAGVVLRRLWAAQRVLSRADHQRRQRHRHARAPVEVGANVGVADGHPAGVEGLGLSLLRGSTASVPGAFASAVDWSASSVPGASSDDGWRGPVVGRIDHHLA